MDNYYDYRKFAILYVDDEAIHLSQFTRLFGERFRILTAKDAQEAMEILRQRGGEIGVLLTDQRMPGENGTWLLEQSRQVQPRLIRILVTGYSDMGAAIAAVNTGAIYKYITKPWDPPVLETNLCRALEFFMVQQERDQLLKEKLSVIHNMMIADRIVSLGLLAQGLSHHIRNPLQAVKTFLDLAPMKVEEEKRFAGEMRDPDFWHEYYRNAQTQLDRITKLLNDLWSAQEKPNTAFGDRVRVWEVVDQELPRLRTAMQAKRITIDNRVPRDLPEIGVDAQKFQRLFNLLLRDEITCLPAGSAISITGRYLPETPAGQPELEILVEDNGPGLPTEALRLLFDPFTIRTDLPTEYGINLMACFFIAYHHGGKIEARSQQGRGTTFAIRMPLKPSHGPAEDRLEFLQKLLLNQTLWEKLISTPE
jgi:two-component system probable response regulator PhcQ